jgi:prephenate dehydratase
VSDEAVRYLFRDQDVEPVYCQTIAEVFKTVDSGRTDWGAIPIENTIDGSVNLHMDWLVHEVDLPIRAEWVYPSIQNLIGRLEELADGDGAWDPGKIAKVFSHPVAMAQCRQFLQSRLPHAAQETLPSTSQAVQLVQENPGRGWVAIGTAMAAADFGLDVLEAAITDHHNNFTRFLLVGRKPYDNPMAASERTTLLVTLPSDYPGALHQVLSAFAWRRINLSRIESRPTKKKLGSYYFYIDIEMSLNSVLLPAAIEEIKAIGSQVRVLGSYPTIPYQETHPEVR